jgi:hypothetical protein
MTSVAVRESELTKRNGSRRNRCAYTVARPRVIEKAQADELEKR